MHTQREFMQVQKETAAYINSLSFHKGIIILNLINYCSNQRILWKRYELFSKDEDIPSEWKPNFFISYEEYLLHNIIFAGILELTFSTPLVLCRLAVYDLQLQIYVGTSINSFIIKEDDVKLTYLSFRQFLVQSREN